jgi:hypothetical protein
MMNGAEETAIGMAMPSDGRRWLPSAAKTLDASTVASIDRDDAEDDAGSIIAEKPMIGWRLPAMRSARARVPMNQG